MLTCTVQAVALVSVAVAVGAAAALVGGLRRGAFADDSSLNDVTSPCCDAWIALVSDYVT